MRILLLTDDRCNANRYRNAANETGTLRVFAVRTVAEALERLSREPFDALLSDDPGILHPRILRCPVLWPEAICLLLRGPMPWPQPPKELTFCFPADNDPNAVLRQVGSLPTVRVRQKNPDVMISAFLRRVGVPVSLIGFDCMREAIRILLSVGSFPDAGPLNDIYAILGTELQVSASVAEHAIRHAIDAAWIRADAETLERIFGYTVDSERAAPSNAAFLFRAADQIRLYQREGMGL